MLTVGFIARIRENTVCGMLQGGGRDLEGFEN